MASKQAIPPIIKKFFTTAPIIFPLIALYHIALLIYQSMVWFSWDVSLVYWLRPVIVALYTTFWIGACFLKKKMANAYLVLTMATIALFFFGPDTLNNLDAQTFWQEIGVQFALLKHAVGDIMLNPLPVNILFSFIILFYYRKMEPRIERHPRSIPDELKPKK